MTKQEYVEYRAACEAEFARLQYLKIGVIAKHVDILEAVKKADTTYGIRYQVTKNMLS